MEVITSKEQFDKTISENSAVFVDFYADWCGPCKMVGPIVEELADEYPNITFLKVNVDENEALAHEFGIMSIPTLIAFKDGQVAQQIVGFQPKEAFKEVLDNLG